MWSSEIFKTATASYFGSFDHSIWNEEISINSLAHKVIEMCDSKSLIKYVPYQEAYPRGFEDMARRVPDVSKMHAYTGWNSKFGIEKIISDTRDYFLNLK